MNQLDFLKKSAHLGRLSHAYIFSGNDEELKHDVTKRFIGLVKCDQTDTKKLQAATIADIRELKDFASQAPWSSDCKVIVLEQADEMHQDAQSAFLKLLEEPKGNTIFLLFAKHSHLLLETIRSRAQDISFWKFEKAKAEVSFEKLYKASLQKRFEYAKKLADTPEEIQRILNLLLLYARSQLLEKIRQGNAITKERKIVASIQEISTLLWRTNVNPRLALENLFLCL
ncbi:hypothetical protein IIA94_00745 [Patescibacteria group bacterium]|nr:hypothetical protein [Patescibacteria group bacterium]